ncbi:hypothetical protein GOBAR_DD11763 [Gossypium barbadense]|nr:hypothetical protein GOBAR_DD11763 [Gossypium barbadense]
MEHFEDVIINENRKEIKWIWKMESFHKPARMVGPWICRFVEEKKVVESWIWKGIAKLMEILEKISRLTKWVPENGTKSCNALHFIVKTDKEEKNGARKALILHQPGIEPGSVPWQGTILPLDHWCFFPRGSYK